ncbi:hypothetical protein D3C73_1562840 [compost metagenome]
MRIHRRLGRVNDLACALGNGGAVIELLGLSECLRDLFHGPVGVDGRLSVVQFLRE